MNNPLPLLNPRRPGIWHGGDYNPEQWPKEVWNEDMELMKLARFGVATIGVFSWASLEPEEGRFEFGWLDEVADLLVKNGSHFILATPSAAMPAWLSARHPEALRAGPDGRRRRHGNRVNFCWSSSLYRDKTREISQRLAERYGSHPGLLMWHLSNEYGGWCHCPTCEAAFRQWLMCKYEGSLEALNQAYWTTFWSHTYTDWDQIGIPGEGGEESVFGLTLDWQRFASDQVVDFFLNESAPLREITPQIPITTNMMGLFSQIDYPRLAEHLDFVSWDSYPNFDGQQMTPAKWQQIGFVHDLYRAMKPGRPFMLIESTPSTSNWYPIMRAKEPGAHGFEHLQAVACGSDSAMVFQWRQSKGSGEMYHGAVVTHSGSRGTRIFEETCSTGRLLEGLEGVAGSTTKAEAAIIYDWEAAWALDIVKMPLREGAPYLESALKWHQPFSRLGVGVDVVDQARDLSGYKLVIAPMAFLFRDGFAERVRQFVQDGGTFVTTVLSGHVDSSFLAFDGGSPGPLSEVCGVQVEEVDALSTVEEALVRIEGRSELADGGRVCGIVKLKGAKTRAVFENRFYAGSPAWTTNRFGRGSAEFIAADFDEAACQDIVQELVDRAALHRLCPALLPLGTAIRRRESDSHEHVFHLNANAHPVEIAGLDGRSVRLGPYEVKHESRVKPGVKAAVP